jgi:Zn-dependent protease
MRTHRINVKPEALLLLSAMIIFTDAKTIIIMICAILIHETGHLLAINLLGGYIRSISFGFVGAKITYDGAVSYLDDALIAGAGPMLSAIVAVVSARIGGCIDCETAEIFSGVNLLYCILNLVPVSITDGGRMLNALLLRVFSVDLAMKIEVMIDVICILSLLISGIYVFAKSNGNLTLLLCTILLAEACCKSIKNGVKLQQ